MARSRASPDGAPDQDRGQSTQEITTGWPVRTLWISA